jgi:membrane-associated phospholipid phosphatase
MAIGIGVVTLAVAIGASRIVLDAHWPLDVLAGFALGVTSAATAAWWDASRPPVPP